MVLCNVYAPSISKTDILQSTSTDKNDVLLAEELDKFNVDQWCVDVDIMIEPYNKFLSYLLDKHAPK